LTAPRRSRDRGQSLVEFALVIPIFFTLFVGLIEFSLALNAVLAVNFASRDATLIAAEAGNASGSDCAVLRTVQDRIGAPADPNNVIDVTIFRANTVGQAVPVGSPAQNVYARGGSMACPLASDPSSTIAFHLVGTAGYPEATRCTTLAGCGGGRTLDHIGVDIRYTYVWHTPLRNFVALSGNGYTVDKSNSMRMEPTL
jgi:TadE-like protein